MFFLLPFLAVPAALGMDDDDAQRYGWGALITLACMGVFLMAAVYFLAISGFFSSLLKFGLKVWGA